MDTLDEQRRAEKEERPQVAADERRRRELVERLAATADAPAVATLMLTMSTAALA